MRPRFSSTTPVLALLTALLLIPITGFAKDGRDFAGFYHLTGVSEQGDQMALTLQVHLFNYSDADLKQAVVTLRSARPAPVALGQFQTVKLWRNRTEVNLSQQLTISRHEYELWQKGQQPAVMVIYHDANGQRWERSAQVTYRPGLDQ